eukprot:31032-Pelagococcus_subviridis.AAC.24
MDTPAVATPIAAPWHCNNALACATTINPANDPNPRELHSVNIAGFSCASRSSSSGVFSPSFLSRFRSASGASKPPSDRSNHSGAEDAISAAPIPLSASWTPPASRSALIIGANTNAPPARAEVTNPVVSPSPSRDRAPFSAPEICTERP